MRDGFATPFAGTSFVHNCVVMFVLTIDARGAALCVNDLLNQGMCKDVSPGNEKEESCFFDSVA